MRTIKRILSLTLTLCLLLGAMPLAVSAEDASNPVVYEHDGRVTLIDGATVDTPIVDMDAATRVVEGALNQLGGDERTKLEPWRTLTDACGNRYYVFQQMYDNATVLGGAVKVIADGEGHMLGLTSSIVSELPEAEQGEGISAEEAETAVLEHVDRTRQQTLTVMEGFTDRMILPVALEIDVEAEDDGGSRWVWVVYTDNPDSSQPQSSNLPYLAHYVTLSGEYLYSLPTIMPGDEAGVSGFDASYVFEFMEPVDYTGYVDLSTGGEKELTVTVMRDKRTGMYYLGNIERRIVVADCWDFLYGGGRVTLAYSPDNRQWDQVGLLSLYNYCKAYDYYKAIGWSGGDGLDTPILILNNYCDIDHKPVDNAAYVGGYLGWQIFLASYGNDYSQCLDVLAHEYTHCVTDSVMTYTAYMNDYGAINEAISDIQGKTCQMMMEPDATWTLGDKSTTQVRSMSDPHEFQQPEFTWDVYYVPGVRTPTMLNDQGGVHSNSSLLNYLAWRLYEKGGMTLEEGRSFWFTVDCAMVPGTDYPQLAELLPWALRASGLEKYDVELRRALDATRLGVDQMPEVFDDDRALLTLTLPENEIFDDEQWILYVFSVDVNKLVGTVSDIFFQVLSGDYSVLPPFLQNMLNTPENGDGGLLGVLTRLLFGSEDGESGGLANMEVELLEWVMERFEGVFYFASTNAGQDGRTMRMVCVPGHALPVLIHGVYNMKTDDLDDAHVLACIAGTWFDIGAMPEQLEVEGDTEDGEVEISPETEAYINQVIDEIGNDYSLENILRLFLYQIKGGAVNELPTAGLEDIRPVISDMFSGDVEEEEIPQPRLSRPKETPAEDEVSGETDMITEEMDEHPADAA